MSEIEYVTRRRSGRVRSSHLALVLAVIVLPGCSSSQLHYSALEPYPSVEQLMAGHGRPDQELAWSRDDWTGSVCPASTTRVLVYHHFRGPLGGLIQWLLSGGETVACVAGGGVISLIQDIAY